MVMFIAYVYPGWHHDPFRPAVDEWSLLDRFEPYFRGHIPPMRPLGGPYDDSTLATARRHHKTAKAHGIRAFTYFTYPTPEQFVLSQPLAKMLDVATESSGFYVSTTWCLRLPISEFPLPVSDGSAAQVTLNRHSLAARGASPTEKPLENLTPSDLRYLMGI
jgi:hypothetical protein